MKNELSGEYKVYVDKALEKFKVNPDYDPHPILKAILLAIQTGNEDGIYSGISGNGNDEIGKEPTEAYIVVVEKKEGKYTVLEINDIIMGNKISTYDGLLLIKLHNKLEDISEEYIDSQQINTIFKEIDDAADCIIVIDPSNYIEPRDYLLEEMKKKRLRFPNDEKLISELTEEIKASTKWPDYGSKARMLIAGVWGSKNKKHGVSFPYTKVPKNIVLKTFKMCFIYNPNRNLLKKTK